MIFSGSTFSSTTAFSSLITAFLRSSVPRYITSGSPTSQVAYDLWQAEQGGFERPAKSLVKAPVGLLAREAAVSHCPALTASMNALQPLSASYTVSRRACKKNVLLPAQLLSEQDFQVFESLVVSLVQTCQLRRLLGSSPVAQASPKARPSGYLHCTSVILHLM